MNNYWLNRKKAREALAYWNEFNHYKASKKAITRYSKKKAI